MANNQSLSQTRYNFGLTEIKHRNTIVTTSLHSKGMDSFLAKLPNDLVYKVGGIPPEYANRPDLISNLFYNTPGYWWLLMLVNGVNDPFEGFNSGDRIIIPIF